MDCGELEVRLDTGVPPKSNTQVRLASHELLSLTERPSLNLKRETAQETIARQVSLKNEELLKVPKIDLTGPRH